MSLVYYISLPFDYHDSIQYRSSRCINRVPTDGSRFPHIKVIQERHIFRIERKIIYLCIGFDPAGSSRLWQRDESVGMVQNDQILPQINGMKNAPFLQGPSNEYLSSISFVLD